LMIARGMSLVLAGHPQAAYAAGGALKPTHAVTLHGILVIPLLAWALSFVDWPERRRLRVVALGAAGYVTFAGLVAVENVGGFRPSDMPPAAIAVFALPLVALLGSVFLAVNGLVREFTPGGIQHD
jgi:hypothetical protein